MTKVVHIWCHMMSSGTLPNDIIHYSVDIRNASSHRKNTNRCSCSTTRVASLFQALPWVKHGETNEASMLDSQQNDWGLTSMGDASKELVKPLWSCFCACGIGGTTTSVFEWSSLWTNCLPKPACCAGIARYFRGFCLQYGVFVSKAFQNEEKKKSLEKTKSLFLSALFWVIFFFHVFCSYLGNGVREVREVGL